MSRTHVRMVARDPHEANRVSTPLEMFFDLTFVVAVAAASTAFVQGLIDGSAGHVLITFPLLFFGVWWAWMNFTWFASAYDVDDVPYRLAVLVQMTGVLIFAAGIPRAMAHWDFGLTVLGYVVMRLGMVALWTRAAVSDPRGRPAATRYAVGIALVQVGWSVSLAVPLGARAPLFVVLAVGELGVPIYAESAGRTSWHPRHIAERLGLFTNIVLGEALLAASLGLRTALTQRASLRELLPVVLGGLLSIFSMWWIYFDLPSEAIAERVRERFARRINGAFRWGYGHYLVFASVAATGAGLSLAIYQSRGPTHLTNLEAGFVETVPVALYVLSVWLVHRPYKPPGVWREVAAPLAAAVLVSTSVLPQPELGAGIVMAVLVASNVAVTRRSLDRATTVSAL
ncbi:MAG TPA: low temperature requirement protein A [Acidimicrobiales bacterium]|nr:low temperature requirement protein A [Acidimicrobiales bacterium]